MGSPKLALVIVGLAGCFSPSIPDGLLCGDDSLCPPGFFCTAGTCIRDDDRDASFETSPDAGACAQWSPAPRHFSPCAIPAPGPPLILDQGLSHVIDTDLGTVVSDGGASQDLVTGSIEGEPDGALLISVERLEIGPADTVRVQGARALIVASWSEISIEGTLAASSLTGLTGAGANADACNAAVAGTAGGGGGGGGGFGEAGGTGGTGCATCGTAKLGGAGGTAQGVPAFPHGGCPGAPGGAGPGAGGGGGDGGGAIQLTAREAIDISGRVDVGGAGGRGGGSDAAGGGGGSGGYLGAEAPTVTIRAGAAAAANGGGGGGGADVGNSGSGGDPGALSPLRADGGLRGGAGGDGGDGGARVANAEIGGQSNTGGGGGGGGSPGYILLRGADVSVDAGAMLSPAPVIANL